MTLVFFNNLHIKRWRLFTFENKQFKLVAIRPDSLKNTKCFSNRRFYTLSRSVSLLTSALNFQKIAYGNFAVLLPHATFHGLSVDTKRFGFLTFLWT